jgi:hypothetical protein
LLRPGSARRGFAVEIDQWASRLHFDTPEAIIEHLQRGWAALDVEMQYEPAHCHRQDESRRVLPAQSHCAALAVRLSPACGGGAKMDLKHLNELIEQGEALEREFKSERQQISDSDIYVHDARSTAMVTLCVG